MGKGFSVYSAVSAARRVLIDCFAVHISSHECNEQFISIQLLKMTASCQKDLCPVREVCCSYFLLDKIDQTDESIQYELSLNSAQLEIVYEKSLARLDSLMAYEETRISRVDYIILDADHDVLQSKSERSEYDIEQLLQAERALKQQLLRAQGDLTNLQLSTRSDSRAIQDLKVYPAYHNREYYLSNCLIRTISSQ